MFDESSYPFQDNPHVDGIVESLVPVTKNEIWDLEPSVAPLQNRGSTVVPVTQPVVTNTEETVLEKDT